MDEEYNDMIPFMEPNDYYEQNSIDEYPDPLTLNENDLMMWDDDPAMWNEDILGPDLWDGVNNSEIIYINMDSSDEQNPSDDYEYISQLDRRSVAEKVMRPKVVFEASPYKFNMPSLINIIKRSSVIDENGIPKGIHNNAAEALSNIIYTHLNALLDKVTVCVEERKAKTIVAQDIVKTLSLFDKHIVHF